VLDDKDISQLASLLASNADQLADKIVGKLNRRPPPRLMDIEQTASYMGRSVPAIRTLVGRGVLPVAKIDGKIQIDRVALDKMIEEKTELWQ
jgi:hypothetical protein